MRVFLYTSIVITFWNSLFSPHKEVGYSKDFLYIVNFILIEEGSQYSNDPDDRGGATKFGVDQRSHPNVDIKNLTRDQAIAIYWEEWNKDAAENLPSLLKYVYFDSCINCGSHQANLFLNRSNKDTSKYFKLRTAFYHNLPKIHPNDIKFVKGWDSRTNDLKLFLGVK